MSETSKTARAWVGVLATIGMLTLITAAAGAAEDAKKTVEAGELSFTAPDSWKSVPTRSQMRKAQLQVDPVAGDEFPGLLVVYVFPGGAGTVEANVERWQKQFSDAGGNPPKIESKTVKGKNVDVTRVETSGHYKPTSFPGMPPEPERDNARLLGAIVVTEKFGYFLKFVGPDKTMTAIRPAFDELISSIEVGQK
jgi:hypothetical protein